MRRVLVIGSGGAGKSTFARRLGERTRLPVVHMDAHYWRPGWVEPSKEEWRRQVERLLEADAWIMDGNYGGTMDLRLAAADTVVFLDLPRLTCLWRVFARRWRFRNRTRPDMTEGCPERVSLEFVRWIWTYPRLRRPAILERLAALDRATPVILRSAGEVDRWLAAQGP